QQQLTRRAFLGRAAQGLGVLALASLESRVAAQSAPRIPARAKQVIWLTMAGGPSHLETFDPKPKLAEMNGQPMPESLTKGQQIAQLQGQKVYCLGPMFPFKRFGQSGVEIGELLPHIGGEMDDICLVRLMTTEASNHDPGH